MIPKERLAPRMGPAGMGVGVIKALDTYSDLRIRIEAHCRYSKGAILKQWTVSYRRCSALSLYGSL